MERHRSVELPSGFDPENACRSAERFFATIFGPSAPGDIAIKAGLKSHIRKYRTPKGAAAAAIRLAAQGSDVYYAVGRTIGRSHRQEDIPYLTIAWVDVDCDNEAERASALDRLKGFDPSVSMIVRSASGLHGYWLLEDATDSKLVGAINQELCRRAGGDPNMRTGGSALLRVPGTLAFESHRRTYSPPRVIGFVEGPGGQRYSAQGLADRLGIKPLTAISTPTTATSRRNTRLLQAVASRMKNARQPDGSNGKVSGSCFFTGLHTRRSGGAAAQDIHPSAVVFQTGHYFCSACGLNEPATKWTQRPEVCSWAKELARPARSVPSLPTHFVKAPRIGIKSVSPVLLSTGQAEPARAIGDRWGVLDACGSTLAADDLGGLHELVRRHGGGSALRVFWTCVVLAQHASRDGKFPCSAGRIARCLGYTTNGGRAHSASRKRVAEAIDTLMRIGADIRLSPNTTERFVGPLMRPLGRSNRQWTLFEIHPAVWYQIAHGRAWVPITAKSLSVRSEEAFALYLRATWEMGDRRRGTLDQSLEKLAKRAGVWNADRFSGNRGRYIGTWRRRLDELRRAGALRVAEIIDDGRDLRVHLEAPQSIMPVLSAVSIDTLPDLALIS